MREYSSNEQPQGDCCLLFEKFLTLPNLTVLAEIVSLRTSFYVSELLYAIFIV